MDVLVTNLLLAERSGTEVVTEQLADGLRRAGHRAAVWVSKAGTQAEAMRDRGHVVVERLEHLPWRPDVIHGHHNVMTLTALAALPGVPAVYTCHDATAPFDAAPRHPRVRAWLAVDELCRDRLVADGVPAGTVQLMPNAVDEALHPARARLAARPTRALAVAKNAAHLGAVRAACRRTGVPLDELGPGVGDISEKLGERLAGYDLVFAAARSALEAAFVGCAVVVGDQRGLAGLLTTRVLPRWRAQNFGRAALAWPPDADGFARAIAAYDPADAAQVSARLRAEAGLAGQIRALETVYRLALAAPPADPAEEARALGRFLEDHLPTCAIERPWRPLVEAVSAGRIEPLAPLVARTRDAVIERLDGALKAAGTLAADGPAATLATGLKARWFPAERFQFARGGAHAAPGPARRDLAEAAGFLVYGPYQRLPSGAWEVLFDLAWEDVEDGCGELTFDVLAGPRLLAERRFAGRPPVGAAERSLRFRHDHGDEPLEFRIAASGYRRGRLRFSGAAVRPLA
nr:glycosyltransferase family 4 protein [Caulobacter sp. 17J80-11]